MSTSDDVVSEARRLVDAANDRRGPMRPRHLAIRELQDHAYSLVVGLLARIEELEAPGVSHPPL